MHQRHLQTLAFALFTFVGLPSASAAVCVEVDDTRDSFEAEQQRSTEVIVEDALREVGKEVSDENCETTYTVYNLKFGDKIVANLSGPEGHRKLEAASVEELPQTYDQLVSALIEGKKIGETTTRKNVTEGQENDERLTADTVLYASTGYGATFGGNYAGGPSLSFGWRHEIHHLMIDFSIVDITVPTNLEDSPGPSGTWFRVGAMYMFDQYAAHTPYLGGSLGFGTTNVKDDEQFQGESRSYRFTGRGVNIDLTAGYEFFRTSNVRFIVQSDFTLPTYRANPEREEYLYESNAQYERAQDLEPLYTPSVELSLAGGFSF